MKTCKTCVYWLERQDARIDIPETIEVGQCAKVKQFWASTEWKHNHDGDVYPVLIQPLRTHAFVQDDSDYRAYLLTMPDFGCNQHEVE